MTAIARMIPGLAAALAFALVTTGAGAAENADAALPYQPDLIPLNQYKDRLDKEGLHPPRQDLSPDLELYLAIYSGSTSGVYFTVASVICDTMRANFRLHGIHCVALRSQGSTENRRLMRQGRAQVVVMQSDLTHMAATGTEPIPGAMSVMSLYGEMGLLVVRPRSGIAAPEDLRGKRMNLGPDGSAGQELTLDYLAANGIHPGDLARRDTVPIESSPQGLCSGYIDAFAVWSGHPSRLVNEAIERCDARVIGLSGPGMEAMLQRHPEYSRLTLPADTYRGQTEPLNTYGIKATLIAYQPVDPKIIYWLTRSAVENIELLRKLHPALKILAPRDMFATGNYLPFHPGAARYWTEIGFLPEPGKGKSNH